MQFAKPVANAECTRWIFRTMSRAVFGTLKFRHANSIPGLAFNPDGERVATASEDGTVKIWNVATGQELLIPWSRQGRVHDRLQVRMGRSSRRRAKT